MAIEIKNDLFTKLGVPDKLQHKILIKFLDKGRKLEQYPKINNLTN